MDMANLESLREAPQSLDDAKRAFERAHENFRLAQDLYRAMADEVVATGLRMTAIYHAWQRELAAAALAQNGGRRAPVHKSLEPASESPTDAGAAAITSVSAQP